MRAPAKPAASRDGQARTSTAAGSGAARATASVPGSASGLSATTAPAREPVASERIGDAVVIPLDATGFAELSPELRVAAWHFSEAALSGDRITFDQWHRQHLPMVSLLESIVLARPVLSGTLLDRITLFLKRLWLNRGNHDGDSTLKFLPDFSRDELDLAVSAADSAGAQWHLHGKSLNAVVAELTPALFDPELDRQLTCREPGEGLDVVTASAVNYYQGVTEEEACRFVGMHGLNSTLVKKEGNLVEEVWRAGGEGVAPGRYAPQLGAVIAHIEAALPALPEDQQQYFTHLIRFFRTGDLEAFRSYNREWVKSDPSLDLVIGFLEQYRDPLGHRGEFEGSVMLTDRRQEHIMETISRHARYFESRMPWDPAWSRTELGSVQAHVTNLITLAGSSAPFGYAGVNLPNESRLREECGSRSLLIGNIVRQRRQVYGDAWLKEFSPDESCLERARAYAAQARDLSIALHEVIGHASGRVSEELKGEPENFLREHYNTLEEARADLVSLWHLFDPKLIELKLASSSKVAEEGLWDMVRSTMVTIAKLPRPVAEEDHHRASLLIMQFLMDIKAGVAALVRDGKTYWVVRDPRAMRQGVGTLLMEIMRIKATGDYHAIKALVHRYGMKVDPTLHAELRARGQALGVPEKVAFLNPILAPVKDAQGRVTDATLSYPTDFAAEQLALSARNRAVEQAH